MKSIYYESIAGQGVEYKMIQLTTVRDVLLQKLESVLDDLREKKREADDKCLIETFSLYNALRDTTMDLIMQISVWQQSFTSLRRPQLKQIDYLVKIHESVNFISSSAVNRIFKFQIARSNIFLLPIGRSGRQVNASQRLAEELRKFSNPTVEKVSKCYQVLRECLPTNHMHSIMPLEQWLAKPWNPIVVISDLSLEQEATRSNNESGVNIAQVTEPLAGNSATNSSTDKNNLSNQKKR